MAILPLRKMPTGAAHGHGDTRMRSLVVWPGYHRERRPSVPSGFIRIRVGPSDVFSNFHTHAQQRYTGFADTGPTWAVYRWPSAARTE